MDYEGVNYNRALLTESEYEDCVFNNCIFSEVDLSGINFKECSFQNCDFSLAKVNNTGFNDAKFINCKMLGLHFDKVNVFLLAVDFENCFLSMSSFYKLDLTKTRFKDCNLQEVDFSDADLTSSLFDNCDLQGAKFNHTNLEKVDFRTSFYYSINPETNRLKKAKFSINGIIGLLDKYGIIVD